MAEVFKIEGLKEISDALNDLPTKMQAQIYRALNRKAVKKYVVDNIRNAINYSSRSEKGITVINDRSDPTAVYGGISSKVYWLRWADLGTASRYTHKGAFRGSIIAKNQIQPIILGSVDDIIKYMNEEIGTEMQKIIEKRIKNVNKKLSRLK